MRRTAWRSPTPHEGAGGYPAAARARLARDAADLVAQRRRAGRGRLRGDRPRPARIRRLGPGARMTATTWRPTRAISRRLVRGVLGHERCVVCAGDLGGVVAQDLSLRFEGLVDRLVLFNTIPPVLPDAYREAGLGSPIGPVVRQAADYFVRQSRDADGLAAELDTPERAAALRGRDVRAPLLGGAGRLRPGRRGLHDRAVRRRASASARRSPTTSTSAARARRPRCRACSSRTRRRRWCSTGPRTT